jgi:hypothetical protein
MLFGSRKRNFFDIMALSLLNLLVASNNFGKREGPVVPIADSKDGAAHGFMDFSAAAARPSFRKCFDENAVDAALQVHFLHTKERVCQVSTLPSVGSAITDVTRVTVEPALGTNRSALFKHLRITRHNASALLVCAETSGASLDLLCYRTNISITVGLVLAGGAQLPLPMRIVIHLADLGWLWPHFGGPPTSRSFMLQMKRIHERWDSRLTFGLNQTMVIFDGGFWTDKIPADPLNSASVVDWLRPMPFLHGNKCIAALDAVKIWGKGTTTKQFGHGTDIFKLVSSKSQIADDPLAPTRPARGRNAAGVSLGVAFNSQVILVRGFPNGNCKPSDKIDGQSYDDVAQMTKRMLRWVKQHRVQYRISHVHISSVEECSGPHSEPDGWMPLSVVQATQLLKVHGIRQRAQGTSAGWRLGQCTGGECVRSWGQTKQLARNASIDSQCGCHPP